MAYRGRVVDAELASYLNALGAVLLEGPRACGKTSTGLQVAASSVRLDASPELVALAELNPASVLQGQTPRLIDEWQLAPGLWNSARHLIDERQSRGQFVFSGSAQPTADVTRHSGAGRFARLRMRPMTLAESGAATPTISFAELMAGTKQVSGRSPLSYEALAERAVIGGWPGLLDADVRQAQLFNRAYLEDLARADIPTATGVEHDAEKMRRVLESAARNVATGVRTSAIAADVAGAGEAIGVTTVRRYIEALQAVFAYEAQPAWSVALRSRSRLRQQPRLHLADPALAVAALGVGPQRLARDPEYFGQVFESMAVRDLRVFAQSLDGRVYHYRDNTNLEVDAIIELGGGSWAAFEIKLGAKMIPDAEHNLLKLRDERIDLDRLGKPACLGVITGTEHAYTLPSGVHVVPLGCLGA